MAFYEMLPGSGMPSGLQAGMDSVLNKKFGTSTTYPAEGWPENVNLLGPLPEKTVSSSPIVTFADGADEVPLKKCEITLPASLDGYSEVDVVHCGKNLFDKDNATVIAGYIGSSYYIAANPMTRTAYIPIFPNKTYTISKMVSSRFTVAVAPVIPSDNEPFTTRQSNHSADHLTISSGASDKYLWIFFYNGDADTETIDNILSTIQVEIGSSATTFEPYSGTTHTADLGRTIYGGSVDVVNGQGVEMPTGTVLFSDLTWNYNDSLQVFYAYVTGKVSGRANFVTTSFKTVDKAYQQLSDMEITGTYSTDSINAKDTTVSNVPDFLTKYGNDTIRFQNASEMPFTFDPVPIDSKLGNNTLWAEQGDTEVTYRRDIDLALGE